MNARWPLMAVSIAMFVSGCGSSPQSLIVGKWEVEGAPMKMTAEFNRDGTAKLTMFGQTVQGRYSLSAGNELDWTVNGTTSRSKVNVTATELEVTDDENRTIKYKRQ